MRASSLILASLGFVHDFRTGQLEPDEFRGTPREYLEVVEMLSRTPLTSHTFQSGHESIRQAVWNSKDTYRVSSAVLQARRKLTLATRRTGCKMQVDPESRHIIVMARGQFYWFDVSLPPLSRSRRD